MVDFKMKYGSWAAVAGSAEGLGEAYSTALAERGINLLMIDNQAESMKTLSIQLEQKFNIQTIQLNIDLADEYAYIKIMQEIKMIDCRLLIYNAAFSRVESFLSISDQSIENYLNVNIRTQLKLIRNFSEHLKSQDSGAILMMSSLAGLMGMQLVSVYAATKSFSWNLAESLYHELKKFNIDVMTCIAGATATPAYLNTRPEYGIFRPQLMNPRHVAELTLKKLGKKNLYIPGFSNRLNYFILTRVLPRKMASGIANRIMAKMYRARIN